LSSYGNNFPSDDLSLLLSFQHSLKFIHILETSTGCHTWFAVRIAYSVYEVLPQSVTVLAYTHSVNSSL